MVYLIPRMDAETWIYTKQCRIHQRYVRSVSMRVTAGMRFIAGIRRITMIDKTFWKKVAENWAIEKDVDVPEIGTPPPIFEDDIPDDEINDILSDLGLDDF